MPTPDEILEELRAHRRDLRTLFATKEEDDEDAARKHEDDAKRHEEDATRHRTAARKAREEDDDDDAKRHEDDAKKSRMDAARLRASARTAYAAAAKKKREEDDEDAAKRHDAEAKRLKDEEDAAAKRAEEDDEDAKRHEEDAAAKKGKGHSMVPILAMLLRAMTHDGDNMDAMKDAGNLELLKHLTARVYPAYGKRSQHAAEGNDDAEDTALFKRLIKQYKDDGELHASRSTTDLRFERKLRALEAAQGEMHKLLTDVVHSMRNLATDTPATDTPATGRGLSTDTDRQQNGGPKRRTMSATGGDWRGKFDAQEDEQHQTETDIDAALDAQGLDPVQRIAAKLMMVHSSPAKH